MNVRKPRVFIVDDHAFLRAGLRTLIDNSKMAVCCGEAGSIKDGIDAISSAEPDIAIVDISLGSDSGLNLIEKLRETKPELKAIVVSMHTSYETIRKVFASGAVGYLAKETSPERLIEAILRVYEGEYYLDNVISAELIMALRTLPTDALVVEDDAYRLLTRREQEVFRLLAERAHPSDIADQLFISKKTVENHRTSIMKKLDLESVTDIVEYAYGLGIVADRN